MIREKSDLDAKARKEHEAKFGGYNDFPPGWHEVGVEEYARSMGFTYTPVLVEHRQMLHYADGTNAPVMVGTHLHFFHDGTGTASVADFWAKTVKFFKFGCEHEYGNATEELARRGIRLMAFEHASYCPKCGHLQIVDSSD